jgi:F-type H+-transporting ATPase subunit gamma
MANLKLIRNRIKSVKATQKITSAMKMVAAAKVRRAQARVLAARPFTSHIVNLLKEIVRDCNPIDLQEMALLQRRPVKKVGIIVLSSDRGLCGSYNTNVCRAVLDRIHELQKEGKEVAVSLVGIKSVNFFRHIKIEKLKTYTLLPAVPTVQEAKLIANQVADMYEREELDAVEIISSHFISLLRSEVVNTKFLPVELPPKPELEKLEPQRLFEPSVSEVLTRELLPKYIQNVVYQSLLEAAASELAARMNAMTNASNNARDLISGLTLVYNKARQASITQELLEIVGGAEALRAS